VQSINGGESGVYDETWVGDAFNGRVVKGRDQVKLAQNVGNPRGSVVHESRTSHRRSERARTGAGGLFELDESWPD